MTEGLHRFYGGRDLHFLTFSCYRRRPLSLSVVLFAVWVVLGGSVVAGDPRSRKNGETWGTLTCGTLTGRAASKFTGHRQAFSDFLYSLFMTEGLHRFYGGRDLHFLTFSCYRRRPLFRNEVYCDLFLKILERVRRRYRLVVLGYVVMPEHVHLLVSEPQRGTLSTAVQALKLGLVHSLQCSGGGVVAGDARSRKNGETWGTLICGTSTSGVLTPGTPMSPSTILAGAVL